jgi:DNA primase
MDYLILLGLLKNVLGDYEHKSKSNYAFNCPFCDHHKKKLEVLLETDAKGNNPWHCWVCGVKGMTISSMFKKMNIEKDKIYQLNSLIKKSDKNEIDINVFLKLPDEYISLKEVERNNIPARNAKAYLKKRKISLDDIEKYNIGFCGSGAYSNRIIVPSYDNKGNLNYFIARTIIEDESRKYKNPDVSRDIIPFELFINWNVPVILCEGIFDAMAIKRNAIPLLGKSITKNLMKRLIESKVDKIYIALDDDAIDQAIVHAEKFLAEGKKVYLVELSKKDPSDMGFEEFTKLIQKAKPLTLSTILSKKIKV